MQVIQTDVAMRQLDFDVLDVKGIVGDMDIGGEALERQTRPLIKGEALNADIKVVILELRQGEVGTQIVYGQVIDIKTAWFARLTQHVIGQRRLAHHHCLDLNIKRLGRLILLGLESVDDELHVGRAALVKPRDMAIQADDLTIGDDDAAVDNQILETDARAKLADGQQRVATLVIDEDVLELDLIER